MKRKLILRLTDEKSLLVETEFAQDDLLEASDSILDDLIDTDDGWNEDKLVEELQKKKYITVLGEGPEIIDLMF